MPVTEQHATSIYADQPAAEVISWLEKQWAALNASEKLNATLEVRQLGDDGYMVGLKWTHEK